MRTSPTASCSSRCCTRLSRAPQTPREAEYLAAIEVFYKDYDKIDHEARAERYEQAMQRLHEHYPDDSERRSFRHSRSTAQSTSMTRTIPAS